MNTNFRIATQQDFKTVCEIFTDAILHMSELGIQQWDEIYPDQDMLFDDIRRHQMFVLTENNIPVSTVVLNEYQDEEYQAIPWHYTDEKTAVVHRLCVSPSRQKAGLGKKTVLIAEQELIKQGYSSVRLDAFSQNPFALRLYESLGYTKVGEMHIRKGAFYCYEKRLTVAE